VLKNASYRSLTVTAQKIDVEQAVTKSLFQHPVRASVLTGLTEDGLRIVRRLNCRYFFDEVWVTGR